MRICVIRGLVSLPTGNWCPYPQHIRSCSSCNAVPWLVDISFEVSHCGGTCYPSCVGAVVPDSAATACHLILVCALRLPCAC